MVQEEHRQGLHCAQDPAYFPCRKFTPTTKSSATQPKSWARAFRSKGEILELAGCDLLTISPQLLGELKNSLDPVARQTQSELARQSKIERLALDEKKFRWLLNENAMARRNCPKASVSSTRCGETGATIAQRL